VNTTRNLYFKKHSFPQVKRTKSLTKQWMPYTCPRIRRTCCEVSMKKHAFPKGLLNFCSSGKDVVPKQPFLRAVSTSRPSKRKALSQESLVWPLGESQFIRPLEEDTHRARTLFKKGGKYLGRGTTKRDFDSLNSNSPEFSFLGRSNVGKSSLLNALLYLSTSEGARVSKTPGRTVAAHAFGMGDNAKWNSRTLPSWELVAVDLPGYGFAKVPGSVAQDMSSVIRTYLSSREQYEQFLKAYVLIDARHGLLENDLNMIDHLINMQLPFQPVLTKCDAVKPKRLSDVVNKVTEKLSRADIYNCAPNLIGVSSKTGQGLLYLQTDMIKDVRQMAPQRVTDLRNRHYSN